MAATVASVRLIAPELAALPAADLESHLARAARQLDSTEWGELYDDAQALLAAHLACVANPQLAAPAGPIASESVGSVSRSYAVAAPSAAGPYGATRHGVEFKRLMRQLGVGARVL